jgi:hypothetical protein
VYQADYSSVHPLAVGLAIDTDSEFLFVTHEEWAPYPGNVVEIVNAKTMKYVDTVEATGASDLAGIVVDQGKQKVYVVDRGTKYLYIYNWYPNIPELVQDGNRIELEGLVNQDIGGAWGLALDDENGRLYVASRQTTVRWYDTNDWSHDPNTDYITVSHDAVGVAVDVQNGSVYTGSGFSGTLLSRYDLSAESETSVDVGAPVLGIAVDQQTSLIYLTTYADGYDTYYPNPPRDRLFVFDANLTEQWVSDDIGNPASVAVAGNISYKPGLLTLSKIDDVNDGNCVSVGDYITYTITYGNPVTDPNDPNYIGTVNDVNIVDYLAPGVTYDEVNWPLLAVDPNYDPINRTYTWYIETLAPGDVNSVTLKVEVNKLAEPLGTIHNYCEIECDIAYNTAEVNTPVCCWSPDIIYVDVNAVGSNTGLSWYHADPNLYRALRKAKAWDPNQIWVASGTYKPTTEPGDYYTTFELVNGVDFYGGFAGNETSPSQRNWMINETILDGNLPEYGVSYVVSANDVNETTIIDGFTIKNGWWTGIYSVNSSLIVGHNRIIDNGCGINCINLSSVKVTNCDIINNRGRTNVDGGGIYCEDSNSLILKNCIISKNKSDANGGGIYFNDSSKLIVTDCIIIENEAGVDGGGICDSNSLSSAIANCILTANYAKKGGGLSCHFSEPNITNCIFTGNTAANFHGGAMYNYQASPSVTNCIFTGNWANIYGGGIANYHNSSLALTNCTFSGNWANYGGGICSWNYTDANLTNCVFWDNEADEIFNNSDLSVTYCDVNGGWTGTGNINKDPCFFEVDAPSDSWSEDAFYDSSTFQSTLTDSGADWAVNELAGKFVNPYTLQALQFFIVSNDVNTIKVWSDVTAVAGEGDTYYIYDYHLTVDSACIDAGYPEGDYTGQTDIDGEPRVFDGDANGTPTVDMGADEYYWSPADINSDGFVNFFDYAFFASAWQSDPNDPNYNDVYDLVDNNCIDSNDLARFCEDWLWQTAWAKAFPFSYGRGMGKSMGMDMGEGFFPSIQAKQARPELTAADIEEIIKWLAELWLTDDDVRKMISEDEWLKFTESLIQAAKELINN